MKRRTMITIAIAVALIVSVAPIVPAESSGGCLNCHVDFFRSPSCAIVPFGIGVSWRYGITGCEGPALF
ncbi:MAG: hypothetical protein M1368_05450 [Thaumarchaeota archaeon]|nr:hypothetical protein [Nitrososphaerota archaeon]